MNNLLPTYINFFLTIYKNFRIITDDKCNYLKLYPPFNYKLKIIIKRIYLNQKD